MKLNPQASTSKGNIAHEAECFSFHMLVESNYSHLTTAQSVPKQSFVVHPEDINIKQSCEQMQVLESQQK